MALAKSTNSRGDSGQQVILDGLGSDPSVLENNIGPAGRLFISALEKAVSVQATAIAAYVGHLRKRRPEASPQEIQETIDQHFLRLATSSGAGAGAAATVPGIGFFLGAAAIGAESLVFLDAAAWYTLASAQLRGVDITDENRRRTLILVALLGAKGSAIVDTFVGDVGATKGVPTMTTVARFTAPKLTEMNNRLIRTALKYMTRKFRRAWFGKILPLGIGAVAGTVANRKLARSVIANVRESLGVVPARFTDPVQ